MQIRVRVRVCERPSTIRGTFHCMMDRPLPDWPSTFRQKTVTLPLDRPLFVIRPSTFWRTVHFPSKNVHFNPGQSTFRWTVHFRRIVHFRDSPLSPRLRIRSWNWIMKLYHSSWVIRTEHSSIIAPATVSISIINNERFSSRQMIVKLKKLQ